MVEGRKEIKTESKVSEMGVFWGREGRREGERRGEFGREGAIKKSMKSTSCPLALHPTGMNNTMTSCRHVKLNPRTTAEGTSQLSLRALHLNSNLTVP